MARKMKLRDIAGNPDDEKLLDEFLRAKRQSKLSDALIKKEKGSVFAVLKSLKIPAEVSDTNGLSYLISPGDDASWIYPASVQNQIQAKLSEIKKLQAQAQADGSASKSTKDSFTIKVM